ncbi:Alpha/Beta hydrolase protein [Limtongia smithiae]|uniref:Alpha/Beta hydrolase protein n=1 Tax=Limtongia smithiae TaxID=1125753 RepID=UPI0034CD4EFF
MSSLPCKACITGFFHDGKPLGSEQSICGYDTYVSPIPERPKGVILFLTDIFGWELVNSRLLADTYAKEGNFIVYTPNVFPFQPVPLDYMHSIHATTEDMVPGFVSLWYQRMAVLPRIAAFLYLTRPAVMQPKIFQLARDLKEKHPDLPLFAVGFCWGGKYSLPLGTAKMTPGIMTAVAAEHPSMLTIPDDVAAVVPMSVGFGEKDTYISERTIDGIRKALGESGMDHEIISYTGMEHGFAVRGDVRKPDVKEGMTQAKDQVLNWFVKYTSK